MRHGGFLVSALVASSLACAHEQPKPAPAATPVAAPAPRPIVQEPTRHTCSSDSECADNQLCIRAECVDITPDLAECGATLVHFDFEQSDVRSDDATKLQRMGRCLMTLHKLHVTIAGNADERGTEEYNLALGDKRATAVEDYLQRLGVPQDQLRRVTYGKDRPLCTQHNEECWAKNRRAALKPKELR